MSNKEDLEERVKDAFDFSIKAYEQQKQLFMTVDIKYKKLDGSNSGIVMVLGDTETINHRFEIMENVGRTFGSFLVEKKILGVQDVIFFSEAWVSVQNNKKGKKVDPKNFIMPSKDPNKREVVLATISDGLMIIMKAKEIKRFFDGEKVQVKLEDTDITQQFDSPKGLMESPLLKSFYDSYKEVVDNGIVLSKEQSFNIKID